MAGCRGGWYGGGGPSAREARAPPTGAPIGHSSAGSETRRDVLATLPVDFCGDRVMGRRGHLKCSLRSVSRRTLSSDPACDAGGGRTSVAATDSARFSAGSVPGTDAARVTFANGLAAGWTHMRRAETGRDHNRHPADRRGETRGVRRAGGRRHGRGYLGAAAAHRRSARPVQGDGRRWADHLGHAGARTGTTERYVREWLGNQAAGGYVVYNSVDGTFELPAEQAMVVANEDSPVFLGGAFETIASCYADHDIFVDAFRTGAGVGWQEHDDRLFSGVLRLFRPGYAAHLVDEWLPALDGVVEKLRAGASVADVGCGLGASTIIWLRRSSGRRSSGLDIHEPSIDAARHGGGGGRRGPAGEVRRRDRQGASRYQLRPGVPVRLPARHGRPGRGGPPHPAGTGAGRHAAAGRAASRRRAGGQPEPGRANLLRPVHGDLHAGVAGAGGRPGARCAGR